MDRDLVTLGEIKELADVGRPTVSNWRRRFSKQLLSAAGDSRPPFPEPVDGTETKPLFDAEQVATWLDLRPISDAQEDEPQTYGERLRQGLRLRGLIALRHEAGSADQLIAEALAVIAMDAEGRLRAPEALPASLHEDRSAASDRVEAAARDLVAAKGGPGPAADEILGKLAASLQSDIAITTTPSPIIDIVSALVGSLTALGERRSVINLCAGAGDLLLGLSGAENGTLVAVEQDVLLRKLLAYRLLSRFMGSIEVCSDFSDLDGLHPGNFATADVVIADPPYAPGERERSEESPLVWAEEAVRRLNPDGRAYVVVPAWTLTRAREAVSTAADARERMLLDGRLETIVQLPRRIHPFLTGAEHALLVLRSPQGAESSVLLVDADRMARRIGDGWSATVADVVRMRRLISEESRLIPARALRDGRSILPSHRLVPPEERVDHFEATLEARRNASALLPDARDWLGNLNVAKRTRKVRHRQVGELLRGGQLKLLPGHRIKAADIGETGLTVMGREEMLGASPFGRRRIALEDLASYPRAVTTERGDVLILNEHGVRALVDEVGGCVLLAPVQGLRITAYRDHLTQLAKPVPELLADLWMRPQPLAQLIQAPRNQHRGSGSLVRRVSVRDIDLPDLPPAEVAELEAVLAQTEQRRAELRSQLQALDLMVERLSGGVADGALALRRRAVP
ncbi:N-6 DNA methylase [Streptomyces goshikiensis]|uniref:N-6 DNA methylase n=1 Tax=Streptomyces goshikiensis TaxID=1942 RepID=UPI0036860EC4